MSSPLCPKATDLQSAAFADLLLAHIKGHCRLARLLIRGNSPHQTVSNRGKSPLLCPDIIIHHISPNVNPKISISPIVNHIYLFVPNHARIHMQTAYLFKLHIFALCYIPQVSLKQAYLFVFLNSFLKSVGRGICFPKNNFDMSNGR